MGRNLLLEQDRKDEQGNFRMKRRKENERNQRKLKTDRMNRREGDQRKGKQ